MTYTLEQIKTAQETRYLLRAACAQAGNMRHDKETHYPDWPRSAKMRFTKRYNALLDEIEQIRKRLTDAPPEPLHPNEALGALAVELQKLVVAHWVTMRIFQRRVKAHGVFFTRDSFGDAVVSEWHAFRAIEIANAVMEFEGDILARWDFAIRVFRHVVDREEREQRGFSGDGGSIYAVCRNTQALARVRALNDGWLTVCNYRRNYDKINARVQVWAQLEESK